MYIVLLYVWSFSYQYIPSIWWANTLTKGSSTA